MDAIELCIHGELFFFENDLTGAEIKLIEDFVMQYFMSNKSQCIYINDFIEAVRAQLQISLHQIKTIKVIAI